MPIIKNPDAYETEHVFYHYDGTDVLSIIIHKNQRYLVSCCYLGRKYVATPVTEQDIVYLIDNAFPIRHFFEDGPTWFITWDGEHMDVSPSAPSDMLPKPGAYLDLNSRNTRVYRNKLEEQAKSGHDT